MSRKTQLQLITEFLLASLKPHIQANNIDAWQEHGTIVICNQDLGLEGYCIGKWKHTAVIHIQNFPHLKMNPYNLLALIAAYLIDSGWDRDTYDLADPDIDIDAESDDHTTVLIELELLDDLEIIPDVNGGIVFNGQKYSLDIAPVNVADTIDTLVNIGGDA